MLEFHGIRFNNQGTPERFHFSLSLKEPLHLSLSLYEQTSGDYAKIAAVIDRKIESLFGVSSGGDKRLRFAVAKLFRAKDIASFICRNTERSSLKLQISEILRGVLSIEQKWLLIESLIEKYLTRASAKEKDEQLGDPDSDLNLTLQMISLFFMEQDKERPPANIEMRFVRRQFPRIIWKKNEGLSCADNPIWLPKNLYCRPSRLYYLIMRKAVPELAERPKLGKSLSPLKERARSGFRTPLSEDFFGEQGPEEIRLEFEAPDKQNIQLSMIPETVAESLLSLQKLVQKTYSYNGVKHFLGIFRQLSRCGPDNICRFDVKRHFKLVARISKKGSCSDKQGFLFDNIFKLISSLRVKRRRCENNLVKESDNPFIVEIGVESVSAGPLNRVKKLLLDPLFSPADDNPFRLGAHLNIIPDEIFGESIYKHPLLPGIFSFLTGAWLNNFPEKQGTLEKTTEEIMKGCAFNTTPSSKYSFIRRIRSELDYMDKKSYIAGYKFIKNPNGDRWKDKHVVSASETIIKNIADKTRLSAAREQIKLTV